MGFYLLEHVNPRAANGRFHGHASRTGGVRPRVVCIHTAETAPAVGSAEAVARYFATTDRQASYHALVDSSGVVPLLPDTATAFHCVGFNTPSLGLSFACWAAEWGKHQVWEEQALRHGAGELGRMTQAWGIPLTRITAAQAREGRAGVVTHALMDPARRTDPGAAFPLEQLLRMAGDEEDDMPLTEADARLVVDTLLGREIGKTPLANLLEEIARDARSGRNLDQPVRETQAQMKELQAKVSALPAAVADQLDGTGVAADEVAQAVRRAIGGLELDLVVSEAKS